MHWIRKNRHKILYTAFASSIVVLTMLVGRYVQLVYWYRDNAQAIHQVQIYREQLGYPRLSTQYLENPSIWSLRLQVKQYLRLDDVYDQLEALEAERAGIHTEFSNRVTRYASAVNEFPEIDTSFLPPNPEQLPFAFAMNQEAYMAKLRQNFYKAVQSYNQTAATPLRYELDADIALTTWTLPQLVSQRFIFAMKGTELTPSEKTYLETYQPGGVVYLGTNVINEAQLSTLSTSIQATNPLVPLFIATDQEGGIVKRVGWDPTGSLPQIAAQESTAQCDTFTSRDTTLSAVGINMNLGLVADITNDSASFIYPRIASTDLERVITTLSQGIKCSEATLQVLKHYPGHGATTVDTHKQLGTLTISEEEWTNTHAQPFRQNPETDAIMIGHLLTPWLNPDTPATLSSEVIDDLRQHGYEHLVLTDDMFMLRASGYDDTQAMTAALAAGNDILLYSADGPERVQLLEQAIQLYQEGETLMKESLEKPIRRIIAAKNEIIRSYDRYVPAELLY